MNPKRINAAIHTLIYLAVVLALCLEWCFAANPEIWIPLSNISVLDGDTIRADWELPLGVTLRQQTIRCSDYDACEVSRHRQTVDVTDAEIKRGLEAKAQLIEMIKHAPSVIACSEENHDVYGRVLARVRLKQGNGWLHLKTWAEDNHFCRGQ